MEKIFEQALLYDFYGELLTEHQRNVYEDAVFNDMSLAEIAEEKGISRQGVHDLIKRCDKILQDYENKLHLVERFTAAKDKIGQIVSLTEIDHTFGKIITEVTTADAVVDKGSMEKYKDYVSRMERIRTLSQELMEDW